MGSKKTFEADFIGCNPDHEIDLLINCTSCGMNGKNPLDIDLSSMNKKSLVYDLVYKPSMTPLMKIAREKKISNTNGFYMLVRQASESFYRWFGVMPKDSHINEVVSILKKND